MKYTKLEITACLELVTGMHIGGSTYFAAIGAVDSPVIKDVRTNLPMIPGSSLKGKMRTLLAKKYNEHFAKEPNDDAIVIRRIFGSSKKNAVQKSRLVFSDSFMSNAEELRKVLPSITETKFENTINRATAIANPRQIERAVRGSQFALSMVYEVEDEAELDEDIKVIADGFKMLTWDYLGGNGSRGYGKVCFKDLGIRVVVGELEGIEKYEEILKKAVVTE